MFDHAQCNTDVCVDRVYRHFSNQRGWRIFLRNLSYWEKTYILKAI